MGELMKRADQHPAVAARTFVSSQPQKCRAVDRWTSNGWAVARRIIGRAMSVDVAKGRKMNKLSTSLACAVSVLALSAIPAAFASDFYQQRNLSSPPGQTTRPTACMAGST